MPFWYYKYMDKLNKIQNQVARAFAHLDAQAIKEESEYVLETADMVIENSKDWEALKNIMVQRSLDRDLLGHIRYSRANNSLEEANEKILEVALKPTLAKQEKRNYRIAKKLFDKGVHEFDFNNQEIVWGGDFQTNWRVEDLMVSLKVIFAGGHNIQRFHPRILVNVK